ncbi:MAG TPA: sulfotransferase [Blastocatellia bacterium]|nr:sulfotransferase [Blastocatellia bacterium]
MIDWCYAYDRRFTLPFFKDTVESLLQRPFNVLFRHQTSIEQLTEFCETYPGLRPTGFIFHMSRCGSTLISQMLATSSQNVVISEPEIVDAVFSSNASSRKFSNEQRVELLRCLIGALGQKRFSEEHRYFVKFDNWAVLDLPLIKQAFPDVPRIFLYRDPVPVMVSNLNEIAGKFLPSAVDPAILGLDYQSVFQMRFEEYLAICLNRFCQAGLDHLDDKTVLVNYRQLPDFVLTDLPAVFRSEFSAEEIEAMKKVSTLHAKRPSAPYTDDTKAKQSQASEFVRQMTEKWVMPVYQQLEAKRLAS